jgi:hypothetical protein
MLDLLMVNVILLNGLLFDYPCKIGYTGYMSLDDMMLKKEIADLLDKESYRIWDSAKVIKNQDYHDGLVKGLKMASQFVAKL